MQTKLQSSELKMQYLILGSSCSTTTNITKSTEIKTSFNGLDFSMTFHIWRRGCNIQTVAGEDYNRAFYQHIQCIHTFSLLEPALAS